MKKWFYFQAGLCINGIAVRMDGYNGYGLGFIIVILSCAVGGIIISEVSDYYKAKNEMDIE